jgi:hypothetical protein
MSRARRYRAWRRRRKLARGGPRHLGLHQGGRRAPLHSGRSSQTVALSRLSSASPARGKISTDNRPAAISAEAYAEPTAPRSIPMAVAATMKGSEVAWNTPATSARRSPTKRR